MNLENHEVQWLEDGGARMVAKLGVEAGHTVVDFGCGVGRYSIPLSKAVAEAGTVYAVERGKEDLAKLKERAERFDAPASLTIVQSKDVDLKQIPSDAADFFFAFDVLQYVEDWTLFCASVDRVLKPSGRVNIYPAEGPHPGEVDINRLTGILKTFGFEALESKDYEMMHNRFRITDQIYTFRRPK